jgi:hypothetical protein
MTHEYNSLADLTAEDMESLDRLKSWKYPTGEDLSPEQKALWINCPYKAEPNAWFKFVRQNQITSK